MALFSLLCIFLQSSVRLGGDLGNDQVTLSPRHNDVKSHDDGQSCI